MKKTMLVLLLLSLCMVCLSAVSLAETQSGTCGENATWTLDDNGLLTISGVGAIADYNDQDAPYRAYKDQIINVTIQDGITRIGRYALSGLENVRSIQLPDSLTSIGTGAFMACYHSLREIRIPANVTSIERYAFNNCDALTAIYVDSQNTVYASWSGVLMTKGWKTLVRYPVGKQGTSYDVPSGTEIIALGAFTGCSLESVVLPDSVRKVEVSAFILCPNLQEVTFNAVDTEIGREIFFRSDNVKIHGEAGSTAEAYAASNGIPFVPFPSSETVYSGEWGSLAWTIDDKGSLTITGTGEMNPFTYSSADAWKAYNSTIKRIFVGDGVTTISDYAFSRMSNLTYVMIQSPVTSIGIEAFGGCYHMLRISIPASTTSISSSAFDGCSSLSSINVDQENLHYSSLDGVLFNKDKTTLVCFPAGIQNAYEIPESVTEIGENAFMNSKASSVHISNSVIHIGKEAFIYSHINDVTISDNVRSIDSEAFWNCDILSVDIPQSVTNIGRRAFGGCINLLSINVDINNPCFASQDGVLFDKGQTTLLCYPNGKEGTYAIPDGVTAIAEYAFQDCNKLTSVIIPEGFTNIEMYSFLYCNGLTSVTLPLSVTYINAYAFDSCNNITDVYYLGTEESWKAVTIGGPYNNPISKATLHVLPQADLILPGSLTSIESQAFANLPSGMVVRVPSSVTHIADDAFAEVSELTILGISGSEAEAFANAHDNISFISMGQ